MVHVQLLGGVTANSDAGGPLEVGPARCQAVLATLALSVGESVTVSRLIDVLWGEDPPATADKTLQGYIARLRKNLGADAIVRAGSAYRLDLDPDRVDVARFRRLIASGDADGALVTWTGRPWSGVYIPGLEAAADGLVEQWLGAIEDQLERRVATDPVGAIAPLAELTAAHPFREELWALFMAALYRVGRQADALAAFKRVREHLVDELGVEPGPRLRELERRILDHDPELVNGPESAATGAVPVPLASERVPAAPTGTVTFGFALLADATRLWEEHLRKMPLAMSRLDAVARSTTEKFDGTVLVAAGESFGAAFHRAGDAAVWADRLQLAVEQEPWPGGIDVRLTVALHTGETVENDGAYFGPAVHTASRLAAAGHPGQTLLSAVTAALLERHDLRDLGTHRLEGVVADHEIRQLDDGDHPPLRTSRVVSGNLPRRPRQLLGRDDELDRIGEAMTQSPLVTLIGPGGIGKTTLALAAAHRARTDERRGVWLVELATITDTTDVPRATAETLGITGGDGRTLTESIVAALRVRPSLLVLDNCEHVIDGAAELAHAVAADDTRVLATSREGLGVSGELLIVVPPLDVAAGVELFVRRSQGNLGREAGGEHDERRDAELHWLPERYNPPIGPVAVGSRMLEFALLGPLEIKRDGAAVHVGATKQRTLLLRLLIEPGSFVSVETLVEDLWPHDPPPGAAATIRSYVSHLRRALGGPPDSAVLRSSQGRGYTLEVSLEAVDAGRFQQLAADGRARLRSGDAASAIELFDDALALWRGEPLSDVSYENFAAAEIARLSQLGLSVCEDRFEALLAADRHHEAIPGLDAFITANPMRERPVGQLMIGLYRAGRAPDSLGVFQRFRERLSDEVGIDPSPTLQQLHQRVLQQSPDLDLVGPIGAVDPGLREGAPPVAGRAAPPLPRRLTSIVGRQTELDRLAELLARSRLVSLVGPGGAGKTTLAIAGARISASDNPDGVWFVPLAAESDPARVALAVADTLGVPSDAATADRLVAARLGGRRALLVLDNCEHLADACARFVEALLQSTDDLKVLITSREALGVPGELQMSVPPLRPGEAAELFAERAAAVRPDLDLDPYGGDVARICDRLDGMPLAIELAAARVRTITPSEIASRLDDRFGLLTTGPRTADVRHRTLRGVVDWSHELLSADEQALFRRLAVFRDGWTLRAAEAVCDPDSSGVVLDVLGRLVERSLVVADGDRYAMLESILAYAEERLEASGEEPALRHAHLSYFAGLAASAEPALRGLDQASAHATLKRDDQNLRAALAWARDHVATAPAVGLGLAASLGWYWYVGRQADGRAELSTMLAATRSAPHAVRARALQALSLSLRPGGCIVHANADAADAARQSMVLFDRLGDRSRAALSRLLLAVEGVDGGDVPAHLRAVADARQVLHLEQDQWGMALADFVEMEIRLHQGDPDESLAIGRRAASGFDALGDDWGRSAVRLHLGIGLRLAGDIEHAVPVLTEAATISRDSSLDNNLARSLEELGEAALWRGQLDEAAGWFDEAAAVAEELGDGLLQALVLAGRGDLERLRGDPISARGHYLRAQARLDGVGGPRGVVRALVGQAAASLDVADTSTVEQQLETAGMAAEELNDAALRAAVMEQRARLAAVAGDREVALGLLAEADALRIARRRPRTALERCDVDALTDTDQAVSSVAT